MQRIDTQSIISSLKIQPEVSALVSDRIYASLPKTDKSGVFIVIQDVTENIDVVDGFARVQMRFTAPDDKSSWEELKDVERTITNLIANKGKVVFGSFVANTVHLESNIFQGYDEKTRKVYIRDYTFYFLS